MPRLIISNFFSLWSPNSKKKQYSFIYILWIHLMAKEISSIEKREGFHSQQMQVKYLFMFKGLWPYIKKALGWRWWKSSSYYHAYHWQTLLMSLLQPTKSGMRWKNYMVLTLKTQKFPWRLKILVLNSLKVILAPSLLIWRGLWSNWLQWKLKSMMRMLLKCFSRPWQRISLLCHNFKECSCLYPWRRYLFSSWWGEVA